MMRLSELIGRAVVDMNAAEKLGDVEEVILDTDGCRVAAMVVARGKSLLNSGTHLVVPGDAIHSIGPDAVTVTGDAMPEGEAPFAHLPKRRDIVGRKVVGESGKLFGHIVDVLIEPADGSIIGYGLAEHAPSAALDNLLGGPRHDVHEYLRADADVRAGTDLIVAPDDAILRFPDAFETLETATTAQPVTEERFWSTGPATAGGTQQVFGDITPQESPAPYTAPARDESR